jgi:hypothetical protein
MLPQASSVKFARRQNLMILVYLGGGDVIGGW